MKWRNAVLVMVGAIVVSLTGSAATPGNGLSDCAICEDNSADPPSSSPCSIFWYIESCSSCEWQEEDCKAGSCFVQIQSYYEDFDWCGEQCVPEGEECPPSFRSLDGTVADAVEESQPEQGRAARVTAEELDDRVLYRASCDGSVVARSYPAAAAQKLDAALSTLRL